MNGLGLVKPWIWLTTALVGATSLILSACSEPRASVTGPDVAEPSFAAITPWLGSASAISAVGEDVDSSLAVSHQMLLQEAQQCRDAIVAAREHPSLPGAPALENQRALLLARSKAEPVVFVQAPLFRGYISRGIEARRKALLETKYPRDMVQLTLKTFADNPTRLRELLLRDGYVYTDDPRTARLLTIELTFEKLFNEEKLGLMRGAARYTLTKGKGGLYYYDEGPQKGQRARLLLFDRVWVLGQDPGEPLHLDVRELARSEGIEGMQIAHLGEKHVVAELRFGSEWVPALLDRDGPNLSVNCVVVGPDDLYRVGRARDEAYRRALVLHSLRSAITQQVQMGLPFDEPRTELGQQDGKLRDHWERAYFAGRKSYRFNGDKYQVFDQHGQPMAPQVCIDFVTESLERASGMHFKSEAEPPRKVLGALNFDEILDGHRRQEMSLRNFARTNPHRLAMIDFPQKDWIKYENIDHFFDNLYQKKEEFRPGDIVIIRGRAAWDRYAEIHTHTFFIYESDPVTGMPTLLAGNSGKPRIVTWDDEMLRAPKRSIRHRLRPNMEWLHDHVVLQTPLRGERWAAPLTLSER